MTRFAKGKTLTNKDARALVAMAVRSFLLNTFDAPSGYALRVTGPAEGLRVSFVRCSDDQVVASALVRVVADQVPDAVGARRVGPLGLALGAPLADDECPCCQLVPYHEGHADGCEAATVELGVFCTSCGAVPGTACRSVSDLSQRHARDGRDLVHHARWLAAHREG